MTGSNFEDIPTMLWAAVTNGNGGNDKLDCWQRPVPKPDAGEVLVRRLAASMNNTVINTRVGCYFASITGSTADRNAVQQDKAEQKVDGRGSSTTVESASSRNAQDFILQFEEL
jgi:NADPH:quinone reductase-like Zn-dependent oxidoreductase